MLRSDGLSTVRPCFVDINIWLCRYMGELSFQSQGFQTDRTLVCGRKSVVMRPNLFAASMVFILEGNSGVDAHVETEMDNLTCLRH